MKQTFQYDNTQRLLSAADVAAGTSYTQVLDKRGNRTGGTEVGPQSCSLLAPWWSASWQVDLPFSTRWGPDFGSTCNSSAPANGSYNYWYDREGRRTDTWDEYNLYHVTTGFPQSVLGAGLDSVFQSAVITGGNYLGNAYVDGTYNYFYDAFGRRRAKTTPWSSTDEYFYDLGHQMLSDRGANVVAENATEFPEDDYIWLDGRPVMFIRSKFAPSTWTRTADGPENYCNRDGEAGLCGSFELVTDYLGKPVVSFDRGGTAGTSTYEALGYSNRHEYRVGSPHYTNTSTTLASFEPVLPLEFDGPLRVLFSRANYSSNSTIYLAGVMQTAPEGNKSHVWSDWQYASGPVWDLDWYGDENDYGVDVEAYELRAKQRWVWWAWTPLRYPGQYFDAETELHENWNRYYDPSTGRYLAPEPMLPDPSWVKAQAQQGMLAPTYAYARNNPIRWADRTGLESENPNCTRRYSGTVTKTPGRTASPGSGETGFMQCQCQLREQDPSGVNTCYVRLFNFEPDGESCPPTLKGGLKDCPSHCEGLIRDLGYDPTASGWTKATCPAPPSLLSCGGQPQISKFIKNISCSGAP